MKLINKIIKPLLGIVRSSLIFMIMFSCGPGAEDRGINRNTEPDSDSTTVVYSIDEKANDTAELPPPVRYPKPAPQQKSARLVYNYSPEMTRNVSKDINVYVSIVNPMAVVKDKMMKILATQQSPSGKKTIDSIVATNILLYKSLKVVLLDPDSAFKIIPVFGEAWQDVDSTGDNRWRWSVIPLTDSPEAKLIIKVVAKKPAGDFEDIDDRTFYIKVKMVGIGQTIRSWISYLQDNKGMVVTVILIPLFAYFGKRYFDRKNKT